MELFQELLFTIGFSLLVSFVIAKVYSMASSSDATVAKSVSVSVVGVVEDAVFCQPKRSEKSVLLTSENRESACFLDEAVEFSELGEETRVETVGSPLKHDDNDVIEVNREVLEEFGENKVSKETVSVEETNLRVLAEEKEIVGEAEFDDSAAKSSRQLRFREIKIELVDKIPESPRFREIEIESSQDELSAAKAEAVRVLETGDDGGMRAVKQRAIATMGIERTELEKRFGAAVVFVGSKSNAVRISGLASDIKMQLYGLHKVAIEGHCNVPQPMALKVSARAKWNAWQQLGEMSREMAMEQYISLLSMCIPEWMGEDTEDGRQVYSDSGASTNLPYSQKQFDKANESISEELMPHNEQSGMMTVESSISMNKGKW
ncbi:hypothetical protein NMG60_11005947 [Bertholletia excelsa]